MLATLPWDEIRNWLSAVGGLVALLIAANTYRRNVRIKREEQARLVFSKMTDIHHYDVGAQFPILANHAQQGNGSAAVQVIQNEFGDTAHLALTPVMQATVVIHNGSKELIGPVRVQIVDAGLKIIRDDFSISVGSVDPETDLPIEFVWENNHHPGLPAVATTLIFRDASGQWWRRHRSEPIERVHADPENEGPTPVERVGIREYQKAIGLSETDWIKEPQPSLHVRLHRLARQLRGKSRLP